jgi:hypothetical protein
LLKVIHTGNALPMSLPVDPTAEFEAGTFAQLKLIGNDIVAGVSDGTAPLGIIDDVRTTAFTSAQVDEVVVVSGGVTGTDDSGDLVSLADVTQVLEFPSIIDDSFTSTISVILNSVNGVITIPAGTGVNYDSDNDGVNDSFKVIVNYIYRVAAKPGDDSTVGSGRITVHYQRGIYASDQFDTTQVYPINENLYIGLGGKMTSKQPTENHPGIAYVTGPPSATNGTLEFMLL